MRSQTKHMTNYMARTKINVDFMLQHEEPLMNRISNYSEVKERNEYENALFFIYEKKKSFFMRIQNYRKSRADFYKFRF